MRLFAAVEVGDAVRVAAEHARQQVSAAVPELSLAFRWVAARELHLTLRFIGEVQDGTAADIQRAIAEPIPLAPFDLTFGEPAWLPGPARPRVLVAAVAGGADELRAVHAEVDARVRAAGVPPETRAFTPHLTLARVREEAAMRVRARQQAVLDAAAAPGRMRNDEPTRVGRVVLFQSVLSPRGPTYTALAGGVLRGPSDAP